MVIVLLIFLVSSLTLLTFIYKLVMSGEYYNKEEENENRRN